VIKLKKDKVLFVNITKQCNVECTRCYLTKENRSKKDLLPMNTLEKIISHDFFRKENVVVIWEGGEVSLVGEKALIERIELVQRILPHARQTMVANLLNLPDWLIDISHKYFDSRVETTFAMGKKYTLNGDADRYREKFKRSLIKANKNNLICPVNIELNAETFEAGTEALVEFIEETNHAIWEFDLSVDFEAFLRSPMYNEYRYPQLSSTMTFKQFSEFIIELHDKYQDRLKKVGFKSTLIEQAKTYMGKNLAFNVEQEANFITINPDGFVTTNPLFTDMPVTYLGNVNEVSADEIFNSNAIRMRVRHEKKRAYPCLSCEYHSACGGGPSHVPLKDGSGECAGGYLIWKHFDPSLNDDK
jgi:radical SAM protein with 4Fe4S-binding SPASM domain